MAFEDIYEEAARPEVGLAAVAITLLLAPPVRRALRRGAIYGLAGMLAVSDAAAGLTRRIGHGAEPAPDTALFRHLAREARQERAPGTQPADRE